MAMDEKSIRGAVPEAEVLSRLENRIAKLEDLIVKLERRVNRLENDLVALKEPEAAPLP